MESRLKIEYKEKIAPSIMKNLGYKNKMMVPTIKKIVVSMGIGRIKDDKQIEQMQKELTMIVGQKAVMTKAKKSIAAFGVREGFTVGIKATLRGFNMWNFFDLLSNVALIRSREYRGYEESSIYGTFGNFCLSLGIRDHSIFPGIDRKSLDKMTGLNIVICTNGKNEEETKVLLENLGLAFKTV